MPEDQITCANAIYIETTENAKMLHAKKKSAENSAYDLLKDKKKSIRHLQEARHDKAAVL